MSVVMTPRGYFCEDCVPEDLARTDPEDLFTIYSDAEINYYPVCRACGRTHTYMQLTPYGERFEAERQGPRSGDVLLTQCGPGDKLLEFSVHDDRVVGVYPPGSETHLRDDVQGYVDENPDTRVWLVAPDGGSELAPADIYVEQKGPTVYVNHRV